MSCFSPAGNYYQAIAASAASACSDASATTTAATADGTIATIATSRSIYGGTTGTTSRAEWYLTAETICSARCGGGPATQCWQPAIASHAAASKISGC
jgi:hypothetical protein